jgi:hypothetical protein
LASRGISGRRLLLIKPSPYFLLFFAQYPWYNYWDFADAKDNSILKQGKGTAGKTEKRTAIFWDHLKFSWSK